MISRRFFLASAAPAAIALGGCNAGLTAFGQKIEAGINVVYSDLVTAARVLEAAIVTAATDIKAAAVAVQPHVVSCCKLIVSMDTLSQTLQQQGTLTPTAGSRLAQALAGLHTAATTGVVSQTAAAGALPTDPLAVATNIIQIASLVVSATNRKVTPTAAVA